MPIDAVYKREAWYVGVAYNPWKIVNNFPEAAQQRLAHWAVYIRPCSSSDKGPMYRVFGMNFLTDTSSDLILEDVWGTPGEGGAGLWKNMICKDEFKQVLEPGIEEKVMYFNLQEFVLHLQWILRIFLRKRAIRQAVYPNPEYAGDKYALLTANCQHFVRFALQSLEKFQWTDRSRLNESFSLAVLGQQIMRDIMNTEHSRFEVAQSGAASHLHGTVLTELSPLAFRNPAAAGKNAPIYVGRKRFPDWH
ncbi:hypothetical protein N7509_007562 [Penicillium cosmopolitanum]|uniref:PPPDE domain-containing protein n=1 Tax=Penicillium cosmopolitanum TaxID=1131564 RepID=A0A9W9VZC4_9EURO|nr:uncharacterized protein N7509_007562 [Penicillium cosmopolitanum]KAJ5392072.1 hypothetical protein N7509_007562 [Penicillium cosmopolitanum]